MKKDLKTMFTTPFIQTSVDELCCVVPGPKKNVKMQNVNKT